MNAAIASERWLPPGKRAAICVSVDDVHPATSHDSYEAGGGLGDGALGQLSRLQQRHRQLKLSLCVTPDWRLNSLVPQSRMLRHIPWLNRRVHWTRLHPKGRFRIDRFPKFVDYLNTLERCQIILHGLHHAHRGPHFAVEFQDEDVEKCSDTLQRGLAIFAAAKLNFVRTGFMPPAWNAPLPLLRALERHSFTFLCAARDLLTPITREAQTAMTGRNGLSLIFPQYLPDSRIVQLTTNFQATSTLDRALEILEMGGVLHIKMHIFKSGGGHVMRDGVDELYCNYLDVVFEELQRRYGDALWWAHLSEVAERVRQCA